MKKYIISVLTALIIASPVLASVIPPPPPTPTLPTAKEQCKKGGWENYAGIFKNQGDCVSFVATDGANQPDGPTAP